jgi:hypothetical protein
MHVINYFNYVCTLLSYNFKLYIIKILELDKVLKQIHFKSYVRVVTITRIPKGWPLHWKPK